jgi:hypothetical protein
MLRALSIAALAIMASGPVLAQVPPKGGMPMGSMKTTKDLDDRASREIPNQQQAQAPATPTYRDTAEDRLMREQTDDGAHDRNDMTR